MLLRAIKNTRASEDQVRESYRRRLDEIFATKQVEPEQEGLGSVIFEVPAVDEEEEEPRFPCGDGKPSPVPADTTAAPTPSSAGPADVEGAAARIAQSLTSCLSAAFEDIRARQAAETGARLQNVETALASQAERLNATATRLVQSQEWQQTANSQLAGMAEALGRLTASVGGVSESLRALRSDQNSQADRLAGLSASLGQLAEAQPVLHAQLAAQAHSIAELTAAVGDTSESLHTMRSDQNSQADRLAGLSATLAQLAEAQPALHAQLAAQAASVAELTAAVTELARAQKAMQSRLDAQAEALRQFHARSGAQQTMLNSYREAVDRLREITAVQALPVTLPENL